MYPNHCLLVPDETSAFRIGIRRQGLDPLAPALERASDEESAGAGCAQDLPAQARM
jgi:hypothetical protein